MKISILLPYKENFSPVYAGAVSLFVKDTTKKSNFREKIIVYGNTSLKKIYNLNYQNIPLKKGFTQSGSKVYVNEFLKFENKYPSDIIEIHNRPNYFHMIFEKNKYKKIVLYFHNDPQTMTGSKSRSDRISLLNNASKIIFNSHWSRKRFLEGITGFHINSEKMIVIYQCTEPVNVNLNKKEKWITFVGKLNRAKGYDLFGNAVLKILNKYKDWRAVVIGDEPRLTLNFQHKRLRNLGFKNHKDALNILKKTSIAVACSRWDEPLGRTSLEATSRGCATIISNRGGLKETTDNAIILKNLDSTELYTEIKKLIRNKKKRIFLQNEGRKKISYRK